ncbi:MAG: hypothetical protein ACO3Z6_09025 [Pseudomonadales bacterium]|jgi:hypothetical protein
MICRSCHAVTLTFTLALFSASVTADESITPPAEAVSTSTEREVNETTAAKAAQVTCRTIQVTGSRVRTRRVCTTPETQDKVSNWVQGQQDRGARESTIIVNSRGG